MFFLLKDVNVVWMFGCFFKKNFFWSWLQGDHLHDPLRCTCGKDKEVTLTHVPRVLVGARCAGTRATMGGEAWTCDIPWAKENFAT